MKGSEKIQFQEKKTVLNKVSVMYDDPYEESPLIPVTLPSASASTRLCHQQVQAILQQSPSEWSFSAENKGIDNYDEKFIYAQLDTEADDLCRRYDAHIEKDIEECSKKMQYVTVADSSGVNIQNIVPVSSAKLYQLSADYGGIVDDSDTNVNADDYDANNDDNVIGNYAGLQKECDGNLLCASNLDTGGGCQGAMMSPPRATHCIISNISGKCEEPWDLSVAQRYNKDKLHYTNPMLSRRHSGNSELLSSTEANSHRPHDVPMNQSHHILSSRQKNSYEIMRNKIHESVMQVPIDLSLSFPIYGVPWGIKSKDGKQDQDIASTRPNRGMGNYATSSFRAGSSKVNTPFPVPARSSSLRPIDSRPMEDYDEPWDQKRKVLCTAGTTGQTASFNDELFSNRTTNPTCSTIASQIDTELPLEKQQWYHACIGRLEAENILCVHREGSYLIRNSESNTKDYSLSVKSAHGFMHMKIVANANDCFILGQFSQPFRSIAQMILHYTIHKLPIKGAEHISLIFPVPCKIS